MPGLTHRAESGNSSSKVGFGSGSSTFYCTPRPQALGVEHPSAKKGIANITYKLADAAEPEGVRQRRKTMNSISSYINESTGRVCRAPVAL